jgi:hypothetical protein
MDANFNASASGGVSAVWIIFWIAFYVVVVIGLWKTLVKAGHPGWGAIIPIYNAYLIIKMAGRPGWWLILLFIPFVNIVIEIIVALDVAKNFGHGVGFGILLIFFAPIMYCVLGFGSSQYVGPRPAMAGGYQASTPPPPPPMQSAVPPAPPAAPQVAPPVQPAPPVETTPPVQATPPAETAPPAAPPVPPVQPPTPPAGSTPPPPVQ